MQQSLGTIIYETMRSYGYTENDESINVDFPTGIFKMVLEDTMYPNSVPVKILQRLLDFLCIPYEVAKAGILETFRIMEERKKSGEYKPKQFATHLWENAEALEKYTTHLKSLMTGVPRRARLDLFQPAELAIRNAMLEVEKMPADTKLTEAVILLGKAKDLVSDFIDAHRTEVA